MKKMFCLVIAFVLSLGACAAAPQADLTEDDAIRIVDTYLDGIYTEYEVEQPIEGIEEFENGELNREDYYRVKVIAQQKVVRWFYVHVSTGETYEWDFDADTKTDVL